MITYTIACIGMTQILVYGKIFNKVRPTKGWFGDLLRCPMCTGFWTGLFLWAISPYTKLFNFDYTLVDAFLYGCIGAGTSYFLSMLVDDYGIRVVHKGGES